MWNEVKMSMNNQIYVNFVVLLASVQMPWNGISSGQKTTTVSGRHMGMLIMANIIEKLVL